MENVDTNAPAPAPAGPEQATAPKPAAPAPPASPAMPPQAGAGRDLAAIVEQWWVDHFPGSAVARDTEAWNTAHAAKDDLKRRLAAI